VRVTARLSHPHILPLLDSGEADGLLYYVMPFVEGESLRDRLTREGPLGLDDALRLARDVADALGHAHAAGVIHRDIKPENILLQAGHAVVADFGIARAIDGSADARLTETGLAIGTPYYMSPEQSQGERVMDGRADIYALGCVLYEMLAGEPPFSGPTAMAVTTRKLTESAPRLATRRESVTPQVDAAVARALARVPADRFRTAHDFKEALLPSSSSTASATVRDGRETDAADRRPGAPARGWRPWVALPAVAAVVAAIVWTVGSQRRQESDGGPIGASVAVLPFANLSPDSAQAYVAEGLTDEIITSLSMIDGLRVASRTSSSLLARQGLELAALAERLSVATVLEGSVKVSAGRVRVAARLVGAKDGYPLWSQTYEQPAADILRIQEEIAGSIAASLRGRLAAGQSDAVRSGTVDPEAYDLHLRAIAQRRTSGPAADAEAVRLYRAAIERDPNFTRAHVGLATATLSQGWNQALPPREAFPAAARAAADALGLEPNNPEAHVVAAYVALYHDWDFERAEQGFLRALELDPNNALGHQWYANYLAVVGRPNEAAERFRRAIALDPISRVRQATIIWVQVHSADAARAVATYRRLAAVDSTQIYTFHWGSFALEAVGDFAESARAARIAYALSRDAANFGALLARALALTGEREEARALLARALAAPYVPSYEVAKAYLALGERAEAFRWLERAYADRVHSLVFLRIDPQFRELRGDPAFEDLARRVGI